MSDTVYKPLNSYPADRAAFNGAYTPIEETNAPDGSYLGPYFTRILIGDYVKTTPFGDGLTAESNNWKPTKEIRLPIPTSLRDSTHVQYDTPNLGSVGDIFNGSGGSTEAYGLRNGVAGAAAGAKNYGDYLADIGKKTKNKSTAAIGNLLAKLGGAVGDNAANITSAIQQGIGLAPNPNPSVAFTGPELRQYSFSWVFYPRNKTESQNIQSLINILKSSALPENNSWGSAAVLKYPKLIQLNFFPWDSYGSDQHMHFWSPSSIIKYKKSFITTVDVDYNPFGTPGFFKDTSLPVTYALSLGFQEVEYMMSGDWGGDFAANNTIFNAPAAAAAPSNPSQATPNVLPGYDPYQFTGG